MFHSHWFQVNPIKYFIINLIAITLGLLSFIYSPLLERIIIVGFNSNYKIFMLIVFIMIIIQPILFRKKNHFGLDYLSSFILGVVMYKINLFLLTPYSLMLIIKYSLITKNKERSRIIQANPVVKTNTYRRIKKTIDSNKK